MILWLACLMILTLTGPLSACPVRPPCRCFSRVIDCTGKGLADVPEFQPSPSEVFTKVLLNNNSITRIEDNVFVNLTIGASLELELQQNNIRYIGEHAFRGLEYAPTRLNLQENNLTSLPRALLSFNDVSSLRVGGITPEDGDVIRHLAPTLRFLQISMDSTASPAWPPEMRYLTNLRILTIDGGRLDSFPETGYEGLGAELTRLEISDAYINTSLTQICYLNSLSAIDITRVNFSSDVKHSILYCRRSMESVTVLEISFSNLNVFPALVKYPSVSRLNLQNNQITTIQASMVPIVNNVKILKLSNNGLRSIPVTAINMMHRLFNVDLAGNRISSLNYGDFHDLRDLYAVNLDDNPISYISSLTFRNCPRLSHLSLKSTRLLTIPRVITNLPKLSSLSLQNSRVTCDCAIVWVLGSLKPRQISGNCLHSSTQISEFLVNNGTLCNAGQIVG